MLREDIESFKQTTADESWLNINLSMDNRVCNNRGNIYLYLFSHDKGIVIRVFNEYTQGPIYIYIYVGMISLLVGRGINVEDLILLYF